MCSHPSGETWARNSAGTSRPAFIFAALAEFERELIRERTQAGLKAARARGRKGGRKFALSKAQVRLAQAAMAHRDTSVSEICRELREGLARARASGRKLGRPKGSLGVSRLDGKEDEIRRFPELGVSKDRHRQDHRRVPDRPLQLHEHPRPPTVALACISTRIWSVP